MRRRCRASAALVVGVQARPRGRGAADRVRRAGARGPAGLGPDRVPAAGARPGGRVPPGDDARALLSAVRAAAGRRRPPLPLRAHALHRQPVVRQEAEIPRPARAERGPDRLRGWLLGPGLALAPRRRRLPRAGGRDPGAAPPRAGGGLDQRRRGHLLVLPDRGGRLAAERALARCGRGLRRSQRPWLLRLQPGVPGRGRRLRPARASGRSAVAAQPAAVLPGSAHVARLPPAAGGGADRGSRPAVPGPGGPTLGHRGGSPALRRAGADPGGLPAPGADQQPGPGAGPAR